MGDGAILSGVMPGKMALSDFVMSACGAGFGSREIEKAHTEQQYTYAG